VTGSGQGPVGPAVTVGGQSDSAVVTVVAAKDANVGGVSIVEPSFT
jgi:hypothetical protein